MSDVERLPFDQYQRYRLVSELLAEVRGKEKSLAILDVGGRTALLRAFLPEDRVTLVDVEVSEEPGLVLGDGAALPFAEDSFDAVLAFDTLEHVPPAARARFVAELARVSRRWVVIAGPFAAPDVDEAERILERFLRDKLQVEHRYLAEHRHNGLPVRAEVERALAAAGASVESVGHGNVHRWLALMGVSMYLDHDPALRGLAEQVYRYYNATLFDDDRDEPVYRHAVVAAFGGAALPSGGRPSARGARPVVGRGARPGDGRGALEQLGFDLIGFDRARDRWQEENRRLWTVNDDLRSDLEGHKTSLAELGALHAEQRGVIAELQKELVRNAGDARAIEREALARAAEERDARTDLERELESHRREVERLREMLAASETAHEAARASVEDLRRAVGELREREAGQLRLEADLRGELARHAEETRAIESAARDRQAAEQEVRLELERDLVLHKSELASHRGEIESLRGLLAREGELHEATRRTASAQDRTIAGLQERIAALESQLGEQRTVIGALEQDLAGHRAVVAELRREGTETRAGAERIGHELRAASARISEQGERIATMRAALRSRLENLKRVVGRKWEG